MITLRKHKHCETCDKPISYADSKGRGVPDFVKEIWLSCIGTYPDIGMCPACLRNRTINKLNERIRDVNQIEKLARTDAYIRGYEHRPNDYGEGVFGRLHCTIIQCPVCEIDLVKGVCLTCKRKYKLKED